MFSAPWFETYRILSVFLQFPFSLLCFSVCLMMHASFVDCWCQHFFLFEEGMGGERKKSVCVSLFTVCVTVCDFYSSLVCLLWWAWEQSMLVYARGFFCACCKPLYFAVFFGVFFGQPLFNLFNLKDSLLGKLGLSCYFLRPLFTSGLLHFQLRILWLNT